MIKTNATREDVVGASRVGTNSNSDYIKWLEESAEMHGWSLDHKGAEYAMQEGKSVTGAAAVAYRVMRGLEVPKDTKGWLCIWLTNKKSPPPVVYIALADAAGGRALARKMISHKSGGPGSTVTHAALASLKASCIHLESMAKHLKTTQVSAEQKSAIILDAARGGIIAYSRIKDLDKLKAPTAWELAGEFWAAVEKGPAVIVNRLMSRFEQSHRFIQLICERTTK